MVKHNWSVGGHGQPTKKSFSNFTLNFLIMFEEGGILLQLSLGYHVLHIDLKYNCFGNILRTEESKENHEREEGDFLRLLSSKSNPN